MAKLRVVGLVLPLFLVQTVRAAAPLVARSWTVDGVERSAVVHVPESAKTGPAPVVFVFHGHGGWGRQAARSFRIHELWPEAVVVYPNGLPTSGGGLTDPDGKKPGWQVRLGQDGDRDLKFFDAVLASLRADYKVDDGRVFCTGHSNGGAFVYFLWAQRGDVFAAVAPSGAFTGPRNYNELTPKPVLHVAGESDPLVKFNLQKAMIDRDVKINGCPAEGTRVSDVLTRYGAADAATPVVTFIHPGGHEFPAKAPAAIVEFFKGRKPAATQPAAAAEK